MTFTMEETPLLESQTWIQKRKRTTYICIMYGFLLGLEYSALVISLVFYLRDQVKTSNDKAYYSAIMTSMSVGASFSGILFGEYMDRTRKLKMSLIIFSTISLIGNLLYTFHYSIWFLVFGRFLCGLSDAAQPVISGEFSRVYKDKELTSILTRYQTVYAIGFIIGPATAILFQPVNFTIGTWHLTKNNFIGFFLSILHLLFVTSVVFGVTDLADSDIETKKEGIISKNEEDDVSIISVVEPNYMSFKDILTNVDILILMLHSSILNYVYVTIELLVNIQASTGFDWSLLRLSVVTTICVILYAIVMFPFGGKLIGDNRRIYYLSILCTILPCNCLALLIITKLVIISNRIAQVTIVSMILLVNIVTGLTFTVCFQTLLFLTVPSHSACYCEGVRNMFSRMFGIVGFFNAALIFPYMDIVLPIIIVSLLFFGGVLCIRKKNI